jgi:hypothetical protein
MVIGPMPLGDLIKLVSIVHHHGRALGGCTCAPRALSWLTVQTTIPTSCKHLVRYCIHMCIEETIDLLLTGD